MERSGLANHLVCVLTEVMLDMGKYFKEVTGALLIVATVGPIITGKSVCRRWWRSANKRNNHVLLIWTSIICETVEDSGHLFTIRLSFFIKIWIKFAILLIHSFFTITSTSSWPKTSPCYTNSRLYRYDKWGGASAQSFSYSGNNTFVACPASKHPSLVALHLQRE